MTAAKLRRTIVPMFTLALLTACTTSFASSNHKTMVQHEGKRSQTIEFSKGKLIEIVYFTVKEDKQKQLSEQYVPKASMISKEYGAKILSFFAIEKKRRVKSTPKPSLCLNDQTLLQKHALNKTHVFKQCYPSVKMP